MKWWKVEFPHNFSHRIKSRNTRSREEKHSSGLLSIPLSKRKRILCFLSWELLYFGNKYYPLSHSFICFLIGFFFVCFSCGVSVIFLNLFLVFEKICREILFKENPPINLSQIWNKDIVSVSPLNWYMQTFTQPACMKESYNNAALEMPVGKYQFMYWNVLVTVAMSLFRLSSWLWVPAVHMHRVTSFTLLWTFHSLFGVWRHDDLPQEKSCFLTTYLLWINVGALGRGSTCSDLEGLAHFIMITFWPTEWGGGLTPYFKAGSYHSSSFKMNAQLFY